MPRATGKLRDQKQLKAMEKAAKAFGVPLSESEEERLEALGVDIEEARENLSSTSKAAQRKDSGYEETMAKVARLKENRESGGQKKFYVKNNKSGMVVLMVASDTNDLANKLMTTGWHMEDVIVTPPDAALIPDDSSPSEYLVTPDEKSEIIYEDAEDDEDLDENLDEDFEDDIDNIPF